MKDSYAHKVQRRIEFLKSQSANFKVRQGIYGVEIIHYRIGFGGKIITSTEIITKD